MRYRGLQIQTQREFPSNSRTQGFGWLVRAGYITRENAALPLGKQAIERLRALSSDPSFLLHLSLPVLSDGSETCFPISTGPLEVARCPSCNYAARLELALFAKTALPQEAQLPL